jgi:hypothetical protein
VPAQARLLSLVEAAARTGRNPELLRRWCASGRIPCERIGRDWLIGLDQLDSIEAMPRRGVNKASGIELATLDVLPRGLADAVRGCLKEGEAVREVVVGIEDSALIATTHRLFVARDGTLVTDPQSGVIAAWPLEWVRRVVLTTGAAAGALVISPAEAGDRPLVLVLGRPHLARADAAAASLRRRLAAIGVFSAED